jgi:hypothetical protein
MAGRDRIATVSARSCAAVHPFDKRVDVGNGPAFTGGISVRIARTLFHAALVLAGALAATTAQAQLHDHLKCYKVKDPSSFSASADLFPADSDTFESDAGCSIKVRSRELCVPVAKGLIETDSPDLDISGIDLTNAFLCYKVRCPATGLPQVLRMSDQFGTRQFTGLRTSTVCAPAIAGAPPVTSTTTSTLPDGIPRNCVNATPPNCDGACNDFNFACVEDAGACVCAYYDVFAPCPMAGHGAPECWGSCSSSLSCLDAGGGACQCGLAFE